MQAQRRLSAKTLLAYQTDLLQLDKYITAVYGMEAVPSINELSTAQLKSWFADLVMNDQLAMRSVARKMAAVKSLFSYALKNGYVPVSIASALTAPRKPHLLPQTLQAADALSMVQYADPQNWDEYTAALMIELLYATGLRRAEVISVPAVFVQAHQLQVLGKGNKERIVPLHPGLGQRLLAYRLQRPVQTPGLFVLKNGKPPGEQWIYRRVKKTLLQSPAALSKGPHVLRHSFATHLLDKGASLDAVKDLLGHSSLAATQVYTHVSLAQLKAAHQLHPRSGKSENSGP